ncbi:MAG: hypothetical protein AAF583_05555 [Pseudomonadota bacterium]
MQDFYEDPVSPYWRFASELSIVQATLLILEIEPQAWGYYVENTAQRPEDYEAVKSALLAALRCGEISGLVACYNEDAISETMAFETFEDHRQCDVYNTFVKVEELKNWLISKGHKKGYFFPADEQLAAYLDANHDRYAPKLAAAVSAWQSFDYDANAPGTPKQKMQKWLRLNATKYGLTTEDGKLNETAIKEISSVANWNQKGGAPRKLNGAVLSEEKPAQDFSMDLDDEIPF